MPAGRPSSYSLHTAETICERLADGESLISICADEGMPAKKTVLQWLSKHEEFRNQYAVARERQAEHYLDEILEISDDGSRDYKKQADGREAPDYDHMARSRLRVDSRKWIMSKLAPKKYGDKLGISGDGDGSPLVVQIMKFSDKGD